jgi:Phytanoyl-CoA dioxygenase (PhyH)
MALRKVLKMLANAVPITATRLDYARFWLTSRRPSDRDPLARSIRDRGYAVVADYWSREDCEACIADFERLLADHPEHVQVYSDRRIFGAEALSPAIARFHDDARLQQLCNDYWGKRSVNAFTLANKVEPHGASKGSGEGWHKDSSFRQFKAFLYLNDVDEWNGPLQVIERSHTLGGYVAGMRAADLPFRHLRINDGQVERILTRDPGRLKTLTGTAGTLIVADTASIHRGCPPLSGQRYALTNYYVEPRQLTPEYLDHYGVVDPARTLGLRGARTNAGVAPR